MKTNKKVEEINKLISDIIKEGIGDKYLANKGVINDPEQELDKQYQKQLRDKASGSDMGVLLGEIPEKFNETNIVSKLYMNPKNLKNFDLGVRAVSDRQGNLYVAQQDENFGHEEMSEIINSKTHADVGATRYQGKSLDWHRVGTTNAFGLGISYAENAPEDYFKTPELQKCLEAVRRKHPEFDFNLIDYKEYADRLGVRAYPLHEDQNHDHEEIDKKQAVLRDYVKVLRDDENNGVAYNLAISYFIILHNFLGLEKQWGEEMKTARKEINAHLEIEPLQDADAVYQKFLNLYDVNSKVRFSVETLDSIEPLRIFLRDHPEYYMGFQMR